ncbi:hypothetical protein QTP88_010746 [Uroleucon formosanum]
MLGNRIGFCKRVQEVNSNAVIIHCFLHPENLATRTIQPELFSVLQDVIQIANFIKSRALNSRIFHAMCEEMGSQYIELDRYIPENVELSKYSWVRNPFEISVHVVDEDICGFQEELLDLQASQVLKENFSRMCLTQFWAQLKDKPILSRESENALLPFPTTYLCEAGFSTLVVIKTKYRNRLDAQHDVRCALSLNIQPNIEELVE